MTTATLSLGARRPGMLAWLAHVVAEIGAGISEGKAIAARYETLSRLSDAQLARLGLTRADIPQAAVSARSLAVSARSL